MRRCFIYLLIVFCLGPIGVARAQLLFPGDFDGNGRVEQYDLLNLGYAFNTQGPPREGDDAPGTAGGGILLAAQWAQQFPDGTNYGTVDADGNGLIDLGDFVYLLQHYGTEWQPAPESVSSVPGTPGIAPPLAFELPQDDTLQLVGGAQIQIPLRLGKTELPVADLNGLAFRIEYDPTYFSEVSFAFPGESSWLGVPPEAQVLTALYFQQRPAPGQIDVAYTRIGPDGISGEGMIGELSLIVVEDMVDLLPNDRDRLLSHVQVTGVVAVDDDFRPLPISRYDLPLYFLRDATSSVASPTGAGVTLFPNPTWGACEITSDEPMIAIDYTDALGRQKPLYRGTPRRSYPIDLSYEPAGIYWVRILLASGRRRVFAVISR